MNVPLMWSAAGDDSATPILTWLIECASSIVAPVTFHGGKCPASEAIRVGFSSVREAMRSWGIRARRTCRNG